MSRPGEAHLSCGNICRSRGITRKGDCAGKQRCKNYLKTRMSVNAALSRRVPMLFWPTGIF